jgi:hypothetical protein
MLKTMLERERERTRSARLAAGGKQEKERQRWDADDACKDPGQQATTAAGRVPAACCCGAAGHGSPGRRNETGVDEWREIIATTCRIYVAAGTVRARCAACCNEELGEYKSRERMAAEGKEREPRLENQQLARTREREGAGGRERSWARQERQPAILYKLGR